MRILLLGLLCTAVGCSSNGNAFNLKVTGSLSGKPVDMSIKSNADGSGALDSSFSQDEGRDVSPLLVVVGAVDGTSSVTGAHCLSSPCPEKGTLTVYTPPPVIYAGPWKAGKAKLSFVTGPDTVGGLDFDTEGGSFIMDFAPPDYRPSGDDVMDEHGKVSGAITANGVDLKVSGDFHLENHCTIQERGRGCGQAILGDGMTNPIHRPYTENTCPAELVKPYEASPVWKGHTLHLGGISVDCRVTDSSHTDNEADKVLCYRRTTMKANGCDWDVHFETDGQLQWFAVAAFAASGCGSVPTCNTYR